MHLKHIFKLMGKKIIMFKKCLSGCMKEHPHCIDLEDFMSQERLKIYQLVSHFSKKEDLCHNVKLI